MCYSRPAVDLDAFEIINHRELDVEDFDRLEARKPDRDRELPFEVDCHQLEEAMSVVEDSAEHLKGSESQVRLDCFLLITCA